VARADTITEGGTITTQIIQRVVGDDLVVADLTDHNPNVFYELAIRHVTRKPLILLIQKEQTIPFDLAGSRVIFVDPADPDRILACREEILGQIDHFQRSSGGLIHTPVSAAFDLADVEGLLGNIKKADVVTGLFDIFKSVADLLPADAAYTKEAKKLLGMR
jgi:hypothetical protein